MDNIKRIAFLLILFVFSFNILVLAKNPLIKNGILDLRGINTKEIGEIELNGEWQFYWNCLFSSIEESNSSCKDSFIYITLPSVWSSYELKGKKLPATGAASYRIQILTDSCSTDLAFKFGSIGTAFNLFVNGEITYSAGRVSLTKDEAIPGYNPGIISFKTRSKTTEIVIQVSNFHYSKGGIWNNYNKIGKVEKISNSYNREIQLSFLLIGSILIFALYHIGLFLQNRNFKYTIYFSLFCFIVIARILVINEIYLLTIFPDFNWSVLIRIEYLTLIIGVMAFSMFIRSFFIDEYSLKILKLFMSIGFLQSMVVILTPPLFFTKYLVIYQMYVLLACVYIFVVVKKAFTSKKPAALILLLGFTLLTFSIVNDVLYTNKVIDTMYLMSFGFIIFIFSQAYMLSSHFSSLYVKTELLAQRLEITNLNLEELVHKRTSKIQVQNATLVDQQNEILAKNKELEKQNIEIINQRDNLAKQHKLLNQQKKHITSSIEYASNIQNAILENANEIEVVAPDNFVLFKPKDIVSGDFYWFKEITIKKKKYKIFSVVDCTGHGVPGAFMSILGAMFLKNVTNELLDTPNAAEILNKMRAEVKNLLHRNVNSKMVKDGMDMAIGIIDYEAMNLQFSGAQAPIYIIRNKNGEPVNSIEEYKGDKMPIGIFVKEKDSFTNHLIDVNKGDLIYLFTDGYYDQFGGKTGEKLMKKTFKKILVQNAHLPLSKQKKKLEKAYTEWKGDFDQIDDITVVGIRI